MDKKLIPGGIYTLNDYCFVYINIYNSERSLFLNVEPEEYNIKEVEEFINKHLDSNHMGVYYRRHKTKQFIEKYDGFIGCINNELLMKIDRYKNIF